MSKQEVVAWKVGFYWHRIGDKPERVVFARETDHYYIFGNGRREKKETSYYRYYASEQEALEACRKNDAELAAKKHDKAVKAVAHELLEALEECLPLLHKNFPSSDKDLAHAKARAVIVKAYGGQA